MKRILFFLVLFFGGAFFHWSVIVFGAAIFASLFAMPLELILAGLFLDSLIYVAPPTLFTIGFLALIIAEELLKSVVKKESWTGMAIIAASGLLVFGLIYLIILK